MNKITKENAVDKNETVLLEIDYDKLATAIVKAKEIEQDKNKQTKSVSRFFATIISIVFGVVGAFSVIMAIGSIIAVFKYLPNGVFNNFNSAINTIGQIVIYLMVFSLFILFAIMLFVSAKEISKEKDRNYIVSVFSALTSLSAFIVAVIALFR